MNFTHVGVFLYDKFLKVEWLHQMVWAFVTFIHITKLTSVAIFQSTHPSAQCVVTFFHIPQSDRWKMSSHWNITLYFSYYEWHWAYFHMFKIHLCFLFCKLFVPIHCPFFYWLNDLFFLIYFYWSIVDVIYVIATKLYMYNIIYSLFFVNLQQLFI